MRVFCLDLMNYHLKRINKIKVPTLTIFFSRKNIFFLKSSHKKTKIQA